ncbi:uncharacterized protein LOC104266820 [Ciona intestinalis]
MSNVLEGRIFNEGPDAIGYGTSQGSNSSVIQDSILSNYIITPCQQDKAGAGSFEVIATVAGAGIGITNIVVIAAILWGGRKLHKATFFCICNLAVADMLAGFLLLWIFGLQKILLPFRTPQSELVQKSIWTMTVWSSMLSQLVIAIDRYCYVTKGSPGDGGMSRSTRRSDIWGNRKRKRLIKAGIGLTWLVPIVTYALPVATVWNCVDSCFCVIPSNSTSDVFYMVCEPVQTCSQVNPPFQKSSILFMGLTLLIMPIIPCVLYAKIYCFVRRSSEKLKPVYTPPLVANNGVTDDNSRVGQSEASVADFQILPIHKTETCNHLLVRPKISQSMIQYEGNGNVTCRKTDGSWQGNGARPPANNRIGLKGWNRIREGSWRRKAMVTRIFTKNSNDIKEEVVQEKRKISSASKAKSAARRRRYRDMRLLRTLVIILVLFLVSTVPLGLLFVVSYTEQDKRYVGTAKVLLTTSLLNSLVNPWIYFWRFPEMRTAMKKVFCRACRFNGSPSHKNDRRHTGDGAMGVHRRVAGGVSFDTNSRVGKNGSKPENSMGKENTSSISSSAL